jgi:transposase
MMEAIDGVVLVIGRGVDGDRSALAEGQRAARRVDHRRVVSGIIRVLEVGCRSCDCKADDGSATTIYNRFNRWSQRWFW